MRSYSVFAALVLGIAALVAPPPAAAHEDHPGWYEDSPTSTSRNVKLLSTVERTRPDTSYRNSDLAFWGTRVYAGHYDGFQIVDIADPQAPRVLTDFPCPGAQNDVSVWQDLLFVSVDAARTAPSCDSAPVPSGEPGWEGIRVFDVSQPSSPRLVSAVATDCGSHTHTLLPDPAARRVLLYVSSYPASHRGRSDYGTACLAPGPGENGGEHSKVSVVEVPWDDPAGARVVNEVPLPLLPAPGAYGCHDITVFPRLQRAAAACVSEGQVWDISDPESPRTIARLHNPHVEFWHSAAFSADGRKVVFGDEAGGGGEPRCRAQDPPTLGAVWFYDLASLDTLDETTVEPPLGSYKVPRLQGDANCTMHNFNVIPVLGRDVLVAAAYAAGTTIVDFTDAANPVEVGHFDPHGANTWSSYWYDGWIVTSDSGRGLDVLLLSDAARAGARRLPYLNPQTQELVLR